MPSQESPELSSYLSGPDAIKLLEFIHQSLSCTTRGDFAALFLKLGDHKGSDLQNSNLKNVDATLVLTLLPLLKLRLLVIYTETIFELNPLRKPSSKK